MLIASKLSDSIVRCLVACSLFLVLGTAVQAQDAAPTATETIDLKQFVQDNITRQAYGVYFGEDKVGWFVEELRLDKHQGKEVAVAVSEGVLSFSSMGAKFEIRFDEKTLFSLDGDGSIILVEEKEVEDGLETLMTGKPKDGKFHVTIQSDGQTTEKIIDLPKETLSQHAELIQWLNGERKQGDQFTAYTLSLDEGDPAVPNKYTFKKMEKGVWGGVPTEILHLSVIMEGVNSTQQLNRQGTLIRGSLGPFDLRAEEEELAKKLDAAVLDMLSIVPIDKEIGDPEDVVKMVLALEGIDEKKFAASHRQKILSSENGVVTVEFLQDFRPEQEEPLSEENRKKFLEATATHQCDAPEIQKLAKKIAGEETDPVKIADRLQKWVYFSLRKSYGANASTSLRVLENRAGDCTEHTLLFVALARAMGIPTREVSGLGYTHIEEPSFGWHAWAEIHDGKHWISVDPTWNEVFVDATHIKVSNDEEDYSAVNLFGKLKISVVSAELKE